MLSEMFIVSLEFNADMDYIQINYLLKAGLGKCFCSRAAQCIFGTLMGHIYKIKGRYKYRGL